MKLATLEQDRSVDDWAACGSYVCPHRIANSSNAGALLTPDHFLYFPVEIVAQSRHHRECGAQIG
jgi:hypothetical protein